MSSKDNSTKDKSSTKAGAAASKDVTKKTSEKKPAKTITVKTDSTTTKATVKSSDGVKKNIGTKVKVQSSDAKSKTTKTEKGLVVREKTIDPELALMASRSAAREHTKPDVTQMRQNGRSMSGMVTPNRSRRRVNTAYSINAEREKALAERREQKEAEAAESRFSKMKSMMIGVGVALVVAVVGFAGIALFGNNKKMCTVHFESNGGSEVAGSEIVCGRTVSEPSAPSKEGFSFEGWMLDGDLFDFSTGVYKNATLVARWKADEGTEIVTVKFDSDGGTKVNDIEVAKGKRLTRPNAPTKIGYVFDDWYLGDKEFDFSQPVNENITLKAKWNRRQTTDSNNFSNNSSNEKPSDKKYAESIAVNDATVMEGESVQVAVMVLPSSAETYIIASSSDNNIAACNVTSTTVTCTGKKAGTVTITVKDDLSGNKKTFTLTVTEKPHEHTYENGVCTGCGEVDPNHTHVHGSDGKCTICGAAYAHNYVDGTCTMCGAKDPNYNPEPVVPDPPVTPDPPAEHTHNYGEDGKCTICGGEKPAEGGAETT